jgi:uncharacterized protein DUF2878
MSALTNFVAYQAVWFIAVFGAARGTPWPAVASLAVFAGGQLGCSASRRSDLKLMALALVCGLLLDGSLAMSGLLRYATPAPALPPGGAPLWILALWVSFSLTLNHSLAWLRGRLSVAVLLGALGGPLAYAAAGRLAGVVVFSAPRGVAVAALACGWAIAMLALARGAGVWAAAPTSPEAVRA